MRATSRATSRAISRTATGATGAAEGAAEGAPTAAPTAAPSRGATCATNCGAAVWLVATILVPILALGVELVAILSQVPIETRLPVSGALQIDWGGAAPANWSRIHEDYQREGFVVVRGAVPPLAVDELFARFPRHSTWATAPFEWAASAKLQQFATLDGLWVYDDAFWNLWHRSRIPAILSAALGAPADHGIRLLTDYVIGVTKREAAVFGQFHQDTTSFDIVEGGVSVWIPLHDVDPERGGGIGLVGRRGVDPACLRPGAAPYGPACLAEFAAALCLPTFSRGDVLVFSDSTVHRSQALLPGAAYPWRYALVGRFFVDTARYRAPAAGAVAQRKNSCRAPATGAGPLQSACYPVVWPQVDAKETRARDLEMLRRDTRLFTVLNMAMAAAAPGYY